MNAYGAVRLDATKDDDADDEDADDVSGMYMGKLVDTETSGQMLRAYERSVHETNKTSDEDIRAFMNGEATRDGFECDIDFDVSTASLPRPQPDAGSDAGPASTQAPSVPHAPNGSSSTLDNTIENSWIWIIHVPTRRKTPEKDASYMRGARANIRIETQPGTGVHSTSASTGNSSLFPTTTATRTAETSTLPEHVARVRQNATEIGKILGSGIDLAYRDIDFDVFFDATPWTIASRRTHALIPSEGHRQVLVDIHAVLSPNMRNHGVTPKDVQMMRRHISCRVSAMAMWQFANALVMLNTDASLLSKAASVLDSRALTQSIFHAHGHHNGLLDPLSRVTPRSKPRRTAPPTNIAIQNALADNSAGPRLISLIGPFTRAKADALYRIIKNSTRGIIQRVTSSIVVAVSHDRKAYVDWRPLFGEPFSHWKLESAETPNGHELWLVPLYNKPPD